jgi:zinc protease
VIPKEPPSKGPVYAHVPWSSPTLPWVTVAFHGPAFSETEKEFSAVNMLLDLNFGPTSDLYKRLVQREQKVDQLAAFGSNNIDPELPTIAARLKKLEDTLYVRDEILKTMASLRSAPPDARRLAEAKANRRYGFARTLDNTESIAGTLARFVRYRRSFDTVNQLYRVTDSLTPADLLAAAKKYLTDDRLVVTTLSKDAMPAAIAETPALDTLAAALAAGSAKAEDLSLLIQKTSLPQLSIKLQFAAGSAHDPKGKEGLATLAAELVSDGGSADMRIDEIQKAFYPMAASFSSSVDKEITTFTLRIHRDNWKAFCDIALPMLLTPGLRDDDFKRNKDDASNALKQDLRADNEEELAKERLQQNLFAGTPYGHPALGSLAGLESITPEDVRSFWKAAYTRANLTVGVNGDAPVELIERLRQELGKLPAGPALPPPAGVAARKPNGIEVEIIQKETRATAISFGAPIEVTRSHPDFAALYLARTWLGEHRSSTSHLFQRIREVRGMNYGDYAYIEAFPRGMFAMLPNPGVPRRSQLFEVWIRPVVPVNAQMALRIAIHELDKLVSDGLSEADFESTREYLMKNVFVMTATQNQQLGYALDSKWYGIPEYTAFMREKLGKLTRADVNAAIRKHLSPKNLSVVIVTKDAKGLADKLIADEFSPITYDAPKPKELTDEDKVIGARKLGIRPESLKITPVDEVFAK